MVSDKRGIEYRFLMIGSGLNLSALEKMEFESLISSVNNWDTILKHAEKHHVKSNIYKNLLKSDSRSLIPLGVLDKLKGDYIKTLIANTKKYADLKHIIQKLNEKGVDIVLLKGVLLTHLLYKDMGLRPMSDIDLLVNPNDLELAKEVFLSNGWTVVQKTFMHKSAINYSSVNAITHTPYIFKKENTCVELHRQLLTYDLLFKINLPDFFNNVEQTEIMGEKAFRFNFNYLLVHLCLHAVNDMYRGGIKLKHLVDIAEMLKSNGMIDFVRLRQICIANNCLVEVQKLIELCNCCFNAPADADFMKKQNEGGFKQMIDYNKLLDNSFEKNTYGRFVFLFFGIYRKFELLKTVDGISSKFKILLSELTPSKEHINYKKRRALRN